MDTSRRAFLSTVGASAALSAFVHPAEAIEPIKRRGGPQMKLSLAA